MCRLFLPVSNEKRRQTVQNEVPAGECAENAQAGQRAAPRPGRLGSALLRFRSGVACACLAAPERAARGCRSGDSRCDSFCRRTCIKTVTYFYGH